MSHSRDVCMSCCKVQTLMVVEARYSRWPNGQLRLRRAILVSRVWGMLKNMAMGCHGSSKFTPLQSCMYRCLCMLKIAEACMAQENWERSTCGPQPSSCFISWSHCQSVQTIYSTAIYHKLFHGAICAISSIDIWQPGPSSTSGSKSGLTPAAQVMGPSGGTSTSWEKSSASSSLVWVQNAILHVLQKRKSEWSNLQAGTLLVLFLMFFTFETFRNHVVIG